MKLLLIAVGLFVTAVAGQLQVQRCSSGNIPTKLMIEGCTKAPCKIVNGKVLRFKAEFINPTATKTLTAKIIPRIGTHAIPFKLPEDQRDGCKRLTNAQCPLTAGQRIKAAGSVPVHSPLNNIKANIEFQLQSDTGIAVCFKINGKIVRGKRRG